MKDFERFRESEIKLQYQLEEFRNELQEQKRYVEQLRQELVSQRNFSPSIHSIQDDDDNDYQQDAQSIHQSGPLTRADLSITGSNPTSTRRNLADGEQFRERLI